MRSTGTGDAFISSNAAYRFEHANLIRTPAMIDIHETGDQPTGQTALEVSLRGRLLLDCSLLNKGSAFPEEERQAFGLEGLLPARVSTLDEQVSRRLEDFREQVTDLDRFLFLRALQDRNETLFYRFLQDHITETLPIIYTPEVGDVCQRYSHIYHRPRGLYISYPHRADMDRIFENRPFQQVDVIVVTDGERILGLGDQGVGGMGIPVGKLSLYTLCGGIDPGKTLPITLDVGTNNQERIADPTYLGWRHERIRGAEYDAFIELFVQAVERHLPGVLLQWEDFAQANARRLLDRYRDRLCTFNDDIQGTAAVTLGALWAAVRVAGGRLRDQQVVFLGAGSAGTGVGDLLRTAMIEDGLTEADARSRQWFLSSRGLLHTQMSGLAAEMQGYAQPAERVASWKRDAAGCIPLAEVVRQVRPTALIGVSGQPGTFTEAVIRDMASHVERPIVFPLSNPTSRSEATPADLVAWTEGRALVATGSPFPNVVYRGRSIPISQCNNSFVFPGVGLGVIAAGARRVNNQMFLAAARVLSDLTPRSSDADVPLLPAIETIRDVARHIALAVGREAQRQGLAPERPAEEWEKLVDARRWEPRYRPLRYCT